MLVPSIAVRAVCLPLAPDVAFVRSLYHSILGRDPDEPGVHTHMAELRMGLSRPELIERLFHSEEYVARGRQGDEFVADLFCGALGRTAEAGEAESWLARLGADTRPRIVAAFVAQPEATALYSIVGTRRQSLLRFLRSLRRGGPRPSRVPTDLRLALLLQRRPAGPRWDDLLSGMETMYAKVDRVAEDLRTDLRIRAEKQAEELRASIERLADSLDVSGHNLAYTMEQLRMALARTRTELSALRSAVDRGADEFRNSVAAIQEEVRQGTSAVLSVTADSVLRSHIGEDASALTAGTAEFLNWALGPTGYAAQREMFINQPSWTHFVAGGDLKIGMSERIVELPYAYARLNCLPVGSAILDFGCCESLLGLGMASLGYRVIALDYRPYPFRHPNLNVVCGLAEDWNGPEEPLDAIVSLSSVEHAGLGAYGLPKHPDADLEIIRRFRDWLKPEGILILTVPFGQASINEFQRTYNTHALDRLLEQWSLIDKRFFIETGEAEWSASDEETAAQATGTRTTAVALISATIA